MTRKEFDKLNLKHFKFDKDHKAWAEVDLLFNDKYVLSFSKPLYKYKMEEDEKYYKDPNNVSIQSIIDKVKNLKSIADKNAKNFLDNYENYQLCLTHVATKFKNDTYQRASILKKETINSYNDIYGKNAEGLSLTQEEFTEYVEIMKFFATEYLHFLEGIYEYRLINNIK